MYHSVLPYFYVIVKHVAWHTVMVMPRKIIYNSETTCLKSCLLISVLIPLILYLENIFGHLYYSLGLYNDAKMRAEKLQK